MIRRSNLRPIGEGSDSTTRSARPSRLMSRVVSPLQQQANRALRWSKQEILLAFFAAFIAGLGAGAAQDLTSWVLE